MKQVTVIFNGKRQASYLLDEAHVVIGRGRSAHIPLDGNPIVSRQHAVIRTEGGQHILEDLGGANGTFVNDAKVRQTRLHDGDRITLGKHLLRYEPATPEAVSLSRRIQRAPGVQDHVSTQAMAALPDGAPAHQIGPAAPPWQRKAAGSASRGAAGGNVATHEHTVAASKQELERLLEQMKIKAGPHLSVPTDGGLQLIALERPPILVGYSDSCQVRVPGDKWFGKVACTLEQRKGKWWIHARAPFWSPVEVAGSRLAKKRQLADNTVIAVGSLRLRFSLGEQG